MKSRIVKKIAALVIVFAMVLSVAGVSMATVEIPSIEIPSNLPAIVHYDVGDGNLNGIPQDQPHTVTLTIPELTSGKITFNITSIVPTRAGFVFDGWEIGSTSYAGGAQASNIAVTRNPIFVVDYYIYIFPVGHWENIEWSTVNVVAQWRELAQYSVSFVNSDASAGMLSGNTSFANIYDGTSWASAGIAVPGCTPNTGYLFDGWYEGDTKINDGEWPTMITGSHTYIARWTQIPAAELDHYTLTYQITGEVGTANTPAAYDGYGEPMIETPGAIEGYNFIGWTPYPINWTLVDTVQEGDDNPVMVSYYEATVTGFYTQMKVIRSEASLYSLLFRGYADGMLFWPADVINSDTQPVADGVPYLAGYEFLGWTPGDLNWEGASLSYIYQVMQPGEGDEQEVPYILEIPVYTITVNATFNQDVPAEPEIPTGVPATGDASWIVFAGIILLAGSAVGGYALIRRKDS